MADKTGLLRVEHLKKYYRSGGRWSRKAPPVRAVEDVSFSIDRGETFGLVGESGCGKSTTGRTLLRLTEPTAGRVLFDGVDVAGIRGEKLRRMRRRMQMIFQDPYASLDPHQNIRQILTEPLRVHGLFSPRERLEKAAHILEITGLSPQYLERYPNQLSGGQRQRIVIARAVILQPELIVADEPVSALDVSVQAQVINLLLRLQREFGLTYLFISHDLNVVRHITDHIAVMYLGRIVETAGTEALFARPAHPYTQALLSAIPVSRPDEVKDRIVLTGEVPSPAHPPQGCAFHDRCRQCMAVCRQKVPTAVTLTPGHTVACHLYAPDKAPVLPD